MGYIPGQYDHTTRQPPGDPRGRTVDPSIFHQQHYVNSAPYAPNHGVISPGGINIPGVPGFLSTAMLQQLTGSSTMGQVAGYRGMSSLDFINMRGRTADAATSAQSTAAMHPFLKHLGDIGTDPLTQRFVDAIDPTRSATASREILRTRMPGASLGYDSRSQGEAASKANDQIARQYRNAQGNPDFKSSYGLTQREIADGVAAFANAGGLGSDKELLAAINSEKGLGEKSRSVAAAISAGKQVYGENKTGKEINELLGQAMGGIENVTPEKASEFLARVQVAARALNVTAEGFAEFVAMQQQAYKQMGAGGPMSTEYIMEAARNGKIEAKLAQENGGGALANEHVSGAIAAQRMMRLQTSQTVNNSKALTYLVGNLTDRQKDTLRVDGRDATQNADYVKALVMAGKNEEADVLMQKMGQLEGLKEYRTLGANMNEKIGKRWGSGAGMIDSEAIEGRKRFMDAIGNTLTPREQELAEKGGGLSRLLHATENFTSKDAIQEQLKALEKQGATAEEIGMMSGKLAGRGAMEENNLSDVQKADVQAAGGQSMARKAQQAKEDYKSQQMITLLNARMGGVAKGLGLGDLVGSLLSSSNGKFDVEAFERAAKDKNLDISGDYVQKLENNVNNGVFDKHIAKANKAEADALNAGKSPEEAKAAMTAVLNDTSDDDLTYTEEEKVANAARESKRAAAKKEGEDKDGTKDNEKGMGFLERAMRAVEKMAGIEPKKETPPATAPGRPK